MRELLETLAAWQAEGVGVGRAVVLRTFGSAPRPEGAVLLVTADGRLAGSISGGCVEAAACEEVARAMAMGRSRVVRYGISGDRAWEFGLACGGTIDVLVEPLVRPEVVAAATAASAGHGGGRTVVTPLPVDAPSGTPDAHRPADGEPPGPILVVSGDGVLTGSLGDVGLDRQLVTASLDALRRGVSRTVEVGRRQFLVEAYPAPPRLVVVGAVHAAIPLVRLAAELGYETVVVDARAAFATSERFPGVDRLIVGWPDEVAEEIGLGPADAVAILSHDAKLDEPAIVAALARGCWYVGAIGSRRTQADRRARLLAAGVEPGALEHLRGPIGLDLGGRAPAEIALAIMAEIVAARHGGTGVPMVDRPPDA